MPQQPTSLSDLLAAGGTTKAFTAPTTSPNLQFSKLKETFANSSSLDANGGVAPPPPNLQASNLTTILAQVKIPNIDLGGDTPPQYIDNLPT